MSRKNGRNWKSTPMMTVDKVAPQKIIRLLSDIWTNSSSEILVDEIFNLGVALYKLGKLDEAIASYDRALLIQPQSSSAIYNLACCHALQGNIDESIDFLQRPIQLDPNEYIKLARQNDDFQLIRNDPRFIALLNLGVSE
jgi:tetratricopeptide (TPR) repeat protein